MSDLYAASLLKNVGSDLHEIDPKASYKVDGLWHCSKCRKPMQIKVNLNGTTHIIRKACDCEQKEFEKLDQQEQEKKDREIIKALRMESMMDEASKAHTFDKFMATEDNARNFSICRRYAEEFNRMKEKNQGLLMLGKPGTGKTFAASCIANYLLERKVRVVMISLVRLISMIQTWASEDNVMRTINRADLLIIDDLGAERSTDFAIERVYNIVDSRYRSKKPMILTTNLSLQEMKDTEDLRLARIYDRVFEVCYPMQFTGKSMRYETAAKRFDEMKNFFGLNS